LDPNLKEHQAMSVTAISPIESTVHKTNALLKELMEELGWEDRERAYRALAAVLHALRDRLTVVEAAELGAQMPTLVRGLYYEGWTPSNKPVKERKREEFLAHIACAFPEESELNLERITVVVFTVLQKHISAGEIGDVKHVLPAQIRALWPEGAVMPWLETLD
jgi:uncharacterized protein (DUF2267 family)